MGQLDFNQFHLNLEQIIFMQFQIITNWNENQFIEVVNQIGQILW